MKPQNRFVRLTQAWDRYWFSPASLQRLAVCRLFAFGLLIVDLVYLGQWDWVFYREIDPFFWEPILFLRILQRAFGFGPPPPGILGTIYIAVLILAAGAFVGYRTRVCGLVSSVLYVYLIAVVYSWVGKVHHTHGVFVLLLLALSLSPCGAALSVDTLLKSMQRAVDRMEFRRQEPETSPYARWPLRLIGIILCLVYFFCGYAKLRIGGLDWMNGETLAYWLLQDADAYSIQLPLIVAQYPDLLKPLSISVVVIELTFPVILFVPRLVWLYLPAGLGFHLGTFLLMNTHFIWWWFTYMVFIDWDAFGRWLKARLAIGTQPASLEMIYDGTCPLCSRTITLVAYLDWFHRISYRDLTDWSTVSKIYPKLDEQACIDEMHVIDIRSGKVYKGFLAFRRVAWGIAPLLPLIPLFWLPGVSIPGQWFYSLMADNRLRVEERCTRHSCR
jgi:predicted DCC family thiol-disulfide oxidoreductase YuxK